MTDGIYTALAGARVMDQNLEVLGNNLANMSTPGYKAQRPVFEQVLVRRLGQPGAAPMQGRPDDRRDVKIAATVMDGQQGGLIETGNDMDVALSGDGFLSVQTQDGVRYTRRGTMSINGDQVLSIAGVPVRGVGGQTIEVPENASLSIDGAGVIFAGNEEIGQLEISRFENPQELVPAGGGLYQANGQALPDEETEVVQGFIENSNVNPVWGMTELIKTNRIFQAAEKAIEAFKNIDDTLASQVGRI